MKDLFRTKDIDENGWLNAEELHECLEIVGFCLLEEDLHFIIKHFDKNGDGKLQIQELLDNIHVLHDHNVHREDLMEAFKRFDTDGNGYIRFVELLPLLTANGFMPVEEARRLITRCANDYDKDMDGRFSYAEFVKMFISKEFQDRVVNREPEEEEAGST